MRYGERSSGDAAMSRRSSEAGHIGEVGGPLAENARPEVIEAAVRNIYLQDQQSDCDSENTVAEGLQTTGLPTVVHAHDCAYPEGGPNDRAAEVELSYLASSGAPNSWKTDSRVRADSVPTSTSAPSQTSSKTRIMLPPRIL